MITLKETDSGDFTTDISKNFNACQRNALGSRITSKRRNRCGPGSGAMAIAPEMTKEEKRMRDIRNLLSKSDRFF